MKNYKKFVLGCLVLGAISCSNDSADDIVEMEETVPPTTSTNPPTTTPPTTPPPTTDVITYEKDVKPIMDTNCIQCHSDPPQRGAPIPLVTFADVQSKSDLVSERMKSPDNPMPRSGLLEASVVKVVDDWIAGGLIEK